MEIKKTIAIKSQTSDIKGINITPFVDVMLVLLIIFMIGSPMVNFSIPVNAPKMKSNCSSGYKSDDISIIMNFKGEIYLDNKLVSITSLENKLKAASFGNKTSRVFIMADENLVYKKIANVIDLVNIHGFKKVSLVFNKN